MEMAMKNGKRRRSKGGSGFRGLKSRGGERRLKRGKGEFTCSRVGWEELMVTRAAHAWAKDYGSCAMHTWGERDWAD